MDGEVLVRLVASIALGLLAWAASAGIHRLVFHPLAHIPGPKLAALTFWYEFYYDVIQPGQYVFKIKELHKQYGPIIRVTPREIHIDDVEFLDEIYPTANNRKRDKDTVLTRGGLPYSVAGSSDHDLHRHRRELMSPFFSQRNIYSLQPLLETKVALMCRYLDQAIDTKRPVNFSDLLFAYTRDIVFQSCFDRDLDHLGNLEEAARVRTNLTKLLLGAKVKLHLPWLSSIMESLPAPIASRMAPPGVKNLMQLRRDIGTEVGQIMAEEANNKHSNKRSVLYELRDKHKALGEDPAELPLRLSQEAMIMVMAGTESPAKTLSIAVFYLMKQPECMIRLRDELSRTKQRPSIAELRALPYLDAVIQEANRLSFGLSGRIARVAPVEQLNYHGTIIPPGTPMSMTTLCVHTDPDVFPDPWKFIPERWLGDSGKRPRRCQSAFGRGARQCIGINLANAEMSLALTAIANYDLELYETDVEDVEFRFDYQVAQPRLDSLGVRASVIGRRARP